MKIELLLMGVVLGIWFVDRLIAQVRADRLIATMERERAIRDAARAAATHRATHQVPTIEGT